MAPILDLLRSFKQKLLDSPKEIPPVVPSATTVSYSEEEEKQLRDRFEAWMVEYKKSYDSVAEKEKRFRIFKDVVREVEEHNASNKSWTKGVNQYADVTIEEYRQQHSKYYAKPPTAFPEDLKKYIKQAEGRGVSR